MTQHEKHLGGKLILPLAGSTASPFFLVSGAGGHVLPFGPMARALAPGRTCMGVLYPGLFAEERDPQSVEEYARRMLLDIEACDPADPVLLFGYSFGGLVAFEIGRILQAKGRACGLVVVDCLLPHARRPRSRPVRAMLRALNALSLAYNGNGATAPARQPSASSATHLAERLKLVGASANRAREQYRPGPCPIPTVLIRATERSSSSRRFRTERELGWGGGLVELLSVVDFPGSHLELFKGHHVADFAAAVERSLQLVEHATRQERQSEPERRNL